jgi:hypothetical protein
VKVRHVRRVFFSGLLFAMAGAFAQTPTPQTPPPQGSGNCPPWTGPHMGFSDGGGPGGHRPGGFSGPDGAGGGMRGGPQLGPPGRWWDDPMFAHDLGLRPEQINRMDNVFSAHRTEIFGAYNSLLTEETALDKITQGAHPDEAGLDSAIDRVAHARASLEKANAHMLLAIRREMDDQQIERLKCYRHFPGSWHTGP